ncbi:hypothetical protein FRC07_003969 [Ceratobasidium sp. 392]|nr:hypothetical protein FRC07_003969 [Ceratobasidium sp. 392]
MDEVNYDNIRIRADGQFVIVQKQNNGLFSERDWEPELVEDRFNIEFPRLALCGVLELAHRQGKTEDTIAALRKRSGGLYETVSFWMIAKSMGLRPGSEGIRCNCYPSRNYQAHEGTIFKTTPNGGSLLQPLDMMPRQGLTRSDAEHLGQLQVEHAYGTAGQTKINYKDCGGHTVYFMRCPNSEWEYFPLYPWEGVETLSIAYQSNELDSVPWEQWKVILKACARRRNQNIDELAVVTQIEGVFRLCKRNCPELGTRPIYFFRNPNIATATPREFWGFFSFNTNPNGPTGISVRRGPDGKSHLVSDWIVGIPPEPRSNERPELSDIVCSIMWVSMQQDWHNMIRLRLELDIRCEDDITWGEDDVKWADDDSDGDFFDEE